MALAFVDEDCAMRVNDADLFASVRPANICDEFKKGKSCAIVHPRAFSLEYTEYTLQEDSGSVSVQTTTLC